MDGGARPGGWRRPRMRTMIAGLSMLAVLATIGTGVAVLLARGATLDRRAIEPVSGQLPVASPPSTGPSPSAVPMPRPHLPNRLRLLVPSRVTVPGSLDATLRWPATGQAAIAVDDLGLRADRGPSRAVPIASVAKVMTAYVILRDHPLAAGRPGPSITVLPAEAAAYPAQVAGLQSVVKVTAGEQLTERQALQALLIASADNVAQILARWDAGTPAAFTSRMNATAASFGMTRTRYTDPSGLAPSTVSTALDQLELARHALGCPRWRRIVAEPSATIPVAGTITNYNDLLGTEGVFGIKTGSDRAAGGCLLFAARQHVGGRTVTILGAVLSQPGTPATVLPNVLSASDTLIRATARAIRPVVVIHAGTVVATQPEPGGIPTTLTSARDLTRLGWPGASYRLTLAAGRAHPRLRVLDTTSGAGTTVPLVPLRP